MTKHGLPIEERFWMKVSGTDDPDGCWLWQDSLVDGYGHFKTSSDRVVIAHRFAYEHEIGPIPEGLSLDHLCRNRACVNPAHLEPVTWRENILRGEGLAAQEAKKTHCPKGHPYSGDNLRIWNGGRYCRACQWIVNHRRPKGAGIA